MTDKLHIEIDGRPLEVEKGSMVIEAADAAGIVIPRFCYHEKLSVAANCRMCLVDIEKAPKPLPACATPVTEGMVVRTRSARAIDAQKGVMEFLLINHPLDCPICDQGGECPLQDLAVGYGGDVSRFAEKKRIVMDKWIGPLIATEMTRCIHCTRCIRFGQEIAGIMELGATGRGEHMRIGTYVERSVDSELSGNMIDLCPVGALTSRPFRFSARSWELQSLPSVSPHDCVGSNLTVQTLRSVVKRVLPAENEAVNEIWLSDRDRYSYEGLDAEDRLRVPLIKDRGQWREVDWQTALNFAAEGLKKVVAAHGADALGALAAPGSTLEEFFLLQKLTRGLGSGNVDHRLRRRDFRDDPLQPPFPWLGQDLADLEHRDAVLLIGTNVRKDQPLIAHRIRKAFLNGATVLAVNPVDYDFTFDLKAKAIVAPDEMLRVLARVAAALSEATGSALPEPVAAWTGGAKPGEAERAIAGALREAKSATLLLGNLAASHHRAADLRALAELVADLAGARLGVLSEANGAGGWLAGCLPHRGPAGGAARAGRDAYAMLADPRRAYLVLGAEPELDCWDGALARRALAGADFVVQLAAFRGTAGDYAQVLLPVAPFTETSGTFVNCEGRWQSFAAAAPPAGETRPAWKVLRVLGNLLGLNGFDYLSSEDIRDELAATPVVPSARLTAWQLGAPPEKDPGLTRIYEVPLYRVDALVRRAGPLQMTRDNPKPAARMHPDQIARLGFVAGGTVRVRVGGAAADEAELALVPDTRVPEGCVLVHAAHPETAPLGGQGPASVIAG
jgi:NADH-quinone oxidoreductase subunit G